jgi:hypothetical protein
MLHYVSLFQSAHVFILGKICVLEIAKLRVEVPQICVSGPVKGELYPILTGQMKV